MFGRSKRTVPKPEIVTSHQSTNPMFNPPSSPELQRFRRGILSVLGIIFTLLGLSLIIYGPWLEINDVAILGTRALNPESVRQVTESYLNNRRWLILPQRNLWIISDRHLAAYLKQKISTKLSIESVQTNKQYPHKLVIKITERTPVFLWTNGTDIASLDRQGVLIEIRGTIEPTLDIIQDDLALPIQPDQQVIEPAVALKLIELQDALRRNHFTVKTFIIPKPICPLDITRPEIITESNDNSQKTPTEVNSNIPVETNVNSQEFITITKPCDLGALRKKSQEIHVQLANGALVLFDRHANLGAAVTTLARLLSKPENANATYIDIRFEERVFIR